MPGLEDLQITEASLAPSPPTERALNRPLNCIDSLLSTSCKTAEGMETHAISVQLGAEADVKSVTVYTPHLDRSIMVDGGSESQLLNFKVF